MRKEQRWAPLQELTPADIFKAEVRAWAERIGVQPKEVHLQPMCRKSASCSTRSRLTFDTDLLTQPATFRAEVIVHDLLHLKVPHHGKPFEPLWKAHLSHARD
jgi:predicted metal-dependent hydrolase